MEVAYVDGHLIIKVPYKQGEVYAKSASGKSRMVATSNGFQTVEGADKLRFSLNVIENLPKGER